MTTVTLKNNGKEVDGGNCYFKLQGQKGHIVKEFKNGKLKVHLFQKLYGSFSIINITADCIAE